MGIVVAGMLIDSLAFRGVPVRLELLLLQLFRVVVLCFCSRPAATTSKPKHTHTHTHRENRPTLRRHSKNLSAKTKFLSSHVLFFFFFN